METQEQILEKLAQIELLLTSQNLSQKEVFTFKEACKFSGYSASYLYKLTASGQIPHFKPEGKQVFFNRTELQSWLQRNRVLSSLETEKRAANYIVNRSQRGGAK